jgi:hypothetical protein
VRQHERVTKNVEFMEDGIRTLLKDGPQPIILLVVFQIRGDQASHQGAFQLTNPHEIRQAVL